MRHVLATVTLALLCAAGAGCSAGTSEDVSGHVGTYKATGEGGNGALLEGTVRLNDGCFFVEASTGERFLVYFPGDQVDWSDERLFMVVPRMAQATASRAAVGPLAPRGPFRRTAMSASTVCLSGSSLNPG